MTDNRAKALEALTEWKISRSTGNADLEHEKAKAMSKAVEEALSEPKWKSMDSCPDKTHAFIWWEYDDRSGPGYYAEAFIIDGKCEITGFKEWDYKHKIPTHWMHKSIVTTPPKEKNHDGQ